MTLLDLFRPSLQGRADRVGLEWHDVTRTFGDIDARSTRLARELAARGLAQGDRLALFLPNRPEYIDRGSAPLAPPVLEAFELRFRHRILERYGMTETLMTLSNPYDGERRAGTVGVPLPGVSVRIVDAAGADVIEGDPGELWVRSPTVCAGYWNRPDATAAAFVDGWFGTDDIATRAADGYVTLRGRQSDLVISGGFNIYPREIEEVLAEHPAVGEVAVAGVPDRARGEVAVAFVVPCTPDAALDEAALDAHCRGALASFKVPRAFVAVDELPRSALGKVQKATLVDGFVRTRRDAGRPPDV